MIAEVSIQIKTIFDLRKIIKPGWRVIHAPTHQAGVPTPSRRQYPTAKRTVLSCSTHYSATTGMKGDLRSEIVALMREYGCRQLTGTRRQCRNRWFEIETPDNRVLRVKHSSAENLKADLLDGYTLRGEIFGCDENGKGCIASPDGDRLGEYLESRGAVFVAPPEEPVQ